MSKEIETMPTVKFNEHDRYRLDKLIECSKYILSTILATAAVVIGLHKAGAYSSVSESTLLIGGIFLLVAIVASLLLFAATVAFVTSNKKNWLFSGFKHMFWGVISFYVGALVAFIPANF